MSDHNPWNDDETTGNLPPFALNGGLPSLLDGAPDAATDIFAPQFKVDEDAAPPSAGEDDESWDDDGEQPAVVNSTVKRTGGSHKASGISGGRVREVLRKYEAIKQAPLPTLELLALYLGTSTDASDLTAALMSKPTAELSKSLDRIKNLRGMDDLSAAVSVMGLTNPTRKILWQTLRALGAELPARPPLNDLSVVTELVNAVRGLGDVTAAVNTLTGLTGKTKA